MDDVIRRPIQETDLEDLCRYSTGPEAAGGFEWTGFTDPKGRPAPPVRDETVG